MRIPEIVKQKYRDVVEKNNAERTFNIVCGFLALIFRKT